MENTFSYQDRSQIEKSNGYRFPDIGIVKTVGKYIKKIDCH
jgi:hypothetical protein